MDPIATIKGNISVTRMIVEGTIEGVTPEQLQFLPPGTALPIGALYVHLLGSEDMFIDSLLQGKPMLAASSWAGKNGVSAPPPQGMENWSDWARSVEVDLPMLRKYALAVYAETDAYVASLSPDDLERVVTLPFEMGGTDKVTVASALGLMLTHTSNHVGEISAIKGIQGLRGYPF